MSVPEIIKLVIIIIIGMAISLAAIHFWVFICDTIIGGIKRLFGFKKKEVNWHTLDGNTQQNELHSKKTEYIDTDHKDNF